MNSKRISLIKNKLKKQLKDKEIVDIVLFGSAVKGKEKPNDIDIAVIAEKEIKIELPGFHISLLKPIDFLINPPTIIHTLLREGYSLKADRPFSQLYKFDSQVLFKYELTSLKPSAKVKIVNLLRGKAKEEGLVKQNSGQWLANQVFIVPTEKEYLFERFFLHFRIKFNKYFVLIH